jgi:hypothetical protein
VISLQDEVFGYLCIPATTTVHDPNVDQITIEQCATSLSGLPHDFQDKITFRDISLALGRQATIRDLAAYIYTVPTRFAPGLPPPPAKPGDDPGYSNSAFHLLGAVVEQASGMSLIDYVNSRLAHPLGIRDLAAGRTAFGQRMPGEVVGYDDPRVGPSNLDLTPDALEAAAYGGDVLLDSAPGSGGLVTSPATVARFLATHAVYGLGGRMGATRIGTFAGTSACASSMGDWDVAFALNREISDAEKIAVRDAVFSYLANHGAALTPFDVDENFPIRGVLLVGGFRTQAELNAMTYDDMRNTLIVELTKHTSEPNPHVFQAWNDQMLAGMGAAMVFFRHTGVRNDVALKSMSPDGQRNTMIVELDIQTGIGAELQAYSTFDLAMIALGRDVGHGQIPGTVDSWIRGVLLLGGFRTQHELNAMTHDDMRNTLIVELTNRTSQANYQSYNDAQLEGVGALLVLLRAMRARDDATLKTMSADDLRNTVIVELESQTRLGIPTLQGFSNLDLVRTALGDRPRVIQ